MNFSLDYYRTFYEIAKNKSFSVAAKALFVSQSSVSQTLLKLESCLDVKLIDRTTKQLKLTASGEILFNALSQSFSLIEGAENKIEKMSNMKEGIIRIGISDSLCKYVFMPYLSRYKRTYPNIHLMLINQPSHASITSLKTGDIDIAIINLMPNFEYKELELDVICTFEDTLITHHQALFNTPISISSLMNAPFVSLEKGTTTRTYIEALFELQGYVFEPSIELTNLDLIVDFVKEGFGISIVPDYAIKNITQVKKIPLAFNDKKRSIALATLKKKSHSVALDKFIQLIKKDYIK